MDWFVGEPTLEETLSDPVVQAVMKCDDVEAEDLRRFLEDVSLRLADETPSDQWLSGPSRHAA